ncbi:response regulator [Endozoicomonas sp. G2_1]|uniref:response regulator transcription factor n=1 Tax=Endozoicomonas sp. G2_1 TaxID=2821091 RepID=UPI001ADB8518|nr:response regulator [Endozoicomonas sp. G2_1]MBO9490664.1 response regulator [Endozoicomonas sp. G2_1]
MNANGANKLLVIEDDQSFANITMRRLTKHGFNCQHAADADQALLACRGMLPDYILLDMKLERSSGLTLLPLLRAIVPSARIVLLTGYASIATAVAAIKQGADDYLAKPVDSQTLINTLLGDSSTQASTDIVNDNVLSPMRVEWEHLQQVLKANKGNISETARQLNMHRRTLQRKLQKKPL